MGGGPLCAGGYQIQMAQQSCVRIPWDKQARLFQSSAITPFPLSFSFLFVHCISCPTTSPCLARNQQWYKYILHRKAGSGTTPRGCGTTVARSLRMGKVMGSTPICSKGFCMVFFHKRMHPRTCARGRTLFACGGGGMRQCANLHTIQCTFLGQIVEGLQQPTASTTKQHLCRCMRSTLCES